MAATQEFHFAIIIFVCIPLYAVIKFNKRIQKL